jgi:hypothetical protein
VPDVDDDATRVDGAPPRAASDTDLEPDDSDDAVDVAAEATAALRRGRPRGPEAGPGALVAAAERARRPSVTPLSLGGGVRTADGESRASLASAVNAPAAALRIEEIERTRVFLKIAIGTVVCATAAALVAGGDGTAKVVLLLSCLLVAVSAGVMLLLTNDRAGYTDRRALIVAVLTALGANGSIYYWGLAGPATGLLVYGIYFFALGAHRGVTLALYLMCAVIQALHAGAIMTGVLADRGLVPVAHLPIRDQLILLSVVEFLYLVAYLTGRTTRRTTLDAVAELERAVRTVAQREALLLEARQELDRALKLGGPGRYTDQVVGSFRLGHLIGRGGMGEVYEGFSVNSDDVAAVKLLHPSTLADPKQVSRFVRETEVASHFASPNVVRVIEVGTTAGEVPFLAMERLRGHDLAHQLRKRRLLPPAATADLITQLATGLEAARQAGIVHRDLKPHNVFLDDSRGTPVWKILDFGVSKLASNHGTLTRGQVVGTPAYMAPEQARGEDVDHRADVYALAAIAYRVITGHPAFSGKDIPSTLYDVVYKAPAQPSLLLPLSADVDRVLAIGMAKAASDRFATALEFAQALSAAIGPGLSPTLRRRADEIIERWPWGVRR